MLKLNDGRNIPQMGFGTWLLKGDDAIKGISCAIDEGYRHFDGAWIYQNEEVVGEILNKKISDGVVKRQDLFITSKLWNCFHRPDLVEKGLDESLAKLKMDYIDMFLIHWPVSYKPGTLFVQESEVTEKFDNVDILDTWKAMEALIATGKTKSIGLSNFNKEQIQLILDNCNIKPANLQIEAHAYWTNEDLTKFCQNEGIKVTAYSPLGSPGRPWLQEGDSGPLDDPVVAELSTQLGISKGQLLIAYILNRGMVCIPKSANPNRIKENFEALKIKLSNEVMQKLGNLPTQRRFVVPNVIKTHKDYPFKSEL